jgi:hypothetical protein
LKTLTRHGSVWFPRSVSAWELLSFPAWLRVRRAGSSHRKNTPALWEAVSSLLWIGGFFLRISQCLLEPSPSCPQSKHLPRDFLSTSHNVVIQLPRSHNGIDSEQCHPHILFFVLVLKVYSTL